MRHCTVVSKVRSGRRFINLDGGVETAQVASGDCSLFRLAKATDIGNRHFICKAETETKKAPEAKTPGATKCRTTLLGQLLRPDDCHIAADLHLHDLAVDRHHQLARQEPAHRACRELLGLGVQHLLAYTNRNRLGMGTENVCFCQGPTNESWGRLVWAIDAAGEDQPLPRMGVFQRRGRQTKSAKAVTATMSRVLS